MDFFHERYHELKQKGVPMIIVTAVAKDGAGPVDVGKKMLVTEQDGSLGTIGGGAIEFYARETCKRLLKSRQHLLESYVLDEDKVIPGNTTLPMVCGGQVTLFYEYQGPKERIYLFGAGHVSQALANILKTLDYHITVIDEREAVIKDFKNADCLMHRPFAAYIESFGIEDDAFVVVATPSHEHDYHVINKIIEKKLHPRYIGMLCSPEKLDDYLKKTYHTFGKVDLSNFYSPIGLKTGGNTPEEIAISISAEILAIRHQIQGHLHMREVHSGQNRYWED
ncbi:MAG: XdhC/CoxI family protein [Candidatus Izemoplasmatales bacterium]|jgi:xanthine dehydrogenase accessory factor